MSAKFKVTVLIMVAFFTLFLVQPVSAQVAPDRILVENTSDFAISGKGEANQWKTASWFALKPYRNESKPPVTRVKMMYSGKGMYFLFDCADSRITSTMNADFMDLWKEDVVEVFLQSDTSLPAYFEYEVSPKNFELPLLIANEKGELRRWMPFYYEENRKTVHKTFIRKENDQVAGWTAEFFIPYALMSPLRNNIPSPGMLWKANFYRIDYDGGTYASWVWKPVRANFHDYENFGIIEFR